RRSDPGEPSIIQTFGNGCFPTRRCGRRPTPMAPSPPSSKTSTGRRLPLAAGIGPPWSGRRQTSHNRHPRRSIVGKAAEYTLVGGRLPRRSITVAERRKDMPDRKILTSPDEFEREVTTDL